MELEGSYFDNDEQHQNENVPQSAAIGGSVTLQIEHWERRLRNFNINPPQVLYRHQLPERSQSSLSYVNDNETACSITNKLLAQQGIVERMRKSPPPEGKLSLTDTLQKRRSQSVDSRFSYGSYKRQESAEGRSKVPSTSRKSRRDSRSPWPCAEVRIQINGEGVEI